MDRRLLALTVLLVLSLGVAVCPAAETKKAGLAAKAIILSPDDLQWKEGPATIPNSQVAVVDGDPSKRGFFVMRMRLPAGTKIPPHVHNNVERVTVLSGKLSLAMGDKQENPKPLPPGSYFSLPAGTPHNAWADEETVLQISTMGPWSLKLLKK